MTKKIKIKVRETIIKSRFARTYRLNQVTASSAADYLANLGATVTKTQTRSTAVTQGDAASGESSAAATTTSDTLTYVQPYGAGTGPLLGLIATTDERLRSVFWCQALFLYWGRLPLVVRWHSEAVCAECHRG